MRRTLVVHSRNAWRSYRTQAALHSRQGLQLFTIEQLAARLAGGFFQPIDPDDLKTAVGEALATPLGELDVIKALPGFQRAAAATLAKAWTAGLDLAAEIAAASDPTATARLDSLATLETAVLARLPKSQLRPHDLVTAALERVCYAPTLFGRIEVHGRTEMSPVWRPLLAAIARETEIVWIAEARRVPEWLSSTGIPVEARAPERPTTIAISCASPRHEILEAWRWARWHLAQGASPQEIAIAAAAPDAWDDHMLALAECANLPIHFVHGRAALSTPQGQLAAALAEILLRGFSRTRLVRLIALLRSQSPRSSSLPGDWWRALPENAPLLDAARWRRAISALTPESFSDGTDHRPLLREIVETLSKGLNEAAEIGQLLLAAKALTVWRKALTEGPPAALDVTLTGLRVDDGVEPDTAILWAPASAVAAVPRPLTWLVGLTSRSWPRRATEDPILPDHIIATARLDPLPVHQADRRDFLTIHDMTSRELVCSRARRDSGGRLHGMSPLYPRGVNEVYLAQSREPEHAASAGDRLLARPDEFAGLPLAMSALQTWIDWYREQITGHDGLVRPNHPLLLRALDRRQSATSLVKLLRDPLGYLWTYGFGWAEPEETDEPLTLDPLAFGNLLHEILEGAVTWLESAGSGGFAGASAQDVRRAVETAAEMVATRWDENRPVPPPVVWKRKRAEAVELAVIALSEHDDGLPDQHSWAEIPFGGDPKADDLSEGVRSALPWDPIEPVIIPGTAIRIGGSIDRLDLAGDGSRARVTDYKSGKLGGGKPPQLRGGAELQRCLYAYAVKALVAGHPQVDARLVYPRKDGQVLLLENPEGTLEKLAAFLTAASASFAAGTALPGPAAEETWYDLALALPGGATESYLAAKLRLVAQELAAIAPLWGDP
ncbi:MAG: PD-(D/E)XK nuclease family protein [Candidatus Binatus sp.]|uniref:PD-(D/E)XK nuclease family protein n=1 Tax=Candidatus Binatus sp. TaxID=2811406 RepID=UPI002720816B|nr:PD-(D/E)XK nuclease family protein [Candidatus Binatus sp.]MDO8434131.1 PD-(D/E)XK nuclease family protein [Candidatus Binatus sp.]